MNTTTNQTITIAIDANEANVTKRVGSNVYAYKLLIEIEKLTSENSNYNFKILLAVPPVNDLPKERDGWQYQIIKPQKFWTQWALPIHLFKNQKKYKLFFTPGHYAPRLCPIPYISSIMDLAYLKFPEQFNTSDLLQLKNWTKYSVKRAKKIICISEFTKQEVSRIYKKSLADLEVIYPDANLPSKACSRAREKAFLRKHQIKQPYFLYLGTLQPRKNLIKLVEAFEIFSRKLAAEKVKKSHQNDNKKRETLPQLLIGGKVGWLAQDLLKRIDHSAFKARIKLLGFVPEELKPSLYQQSLATILIGLYEGFGIPPLEAMHYQTLPIVSRVSSLPEVIGEAGLTVNPNDAQDIATAMLESYKMSARQKAIFKRAARKQIEKFSWKKSAEKLLIIFQEVIKKNR